MFPVITAGNMWGFLSLEYISIRGSRFQFDQELIRQFTILLGETISKPPNLATAADGNSYYEALFNNSPAAIVVYESGWQG
ncbi:MAG: hypothetical protein IPH45_20995 [Bacteroidales bacterium]|nr:hypothetical protein [Bacteroidales bacterium]